MPLNLWCYLQTRVCQISTILPIFWLFLDILGFEPLKEQLRREPRPFPVLKINPAVKDIDSFSYDDFTVEDYVPHKTIKMKMSV